MFKEQVEALLEGGVDLFILETFSELSVIEQAIRAVRELSDLPIVAQMTIQMDGKTTFGTTPEAFTQGARRARRRTSSASTAAWGRTTCSTRSKKCAPLPTKKLSAQPNAGLPRDVQGRQFYMGSPEYMAEFSPSVLSRRARSSSAAAAARRRRTSN